MRNAVPVKQQVALSTGMDYRTICHVFGVSMSTGCVVTKEVCASII